MTASGNKQNNKYKENKSMRKVTEELFNKYNDVLQMEVKYFCIAKNCSYMEDDLYGEVCMEFCAHVLGNGEIDEAATRRMCSRVLNSKWAEEKRRATEEVYELRALADVIDGADLIENTVMRSAIQQVLGSVSEDDRRMFLARYIEGYTLKDIATVENESKVSVEDVCMRTAEYLRYQGVLG